MKNFYHHVRQKNYSKWRQRSFRATIFKTRVFGTVNRSGWLACLSVFRKMLETLVERRFSAVIFLFVFISFYISWYHFSQIFGSSFKNIRKKYFCHEFSFLTDLLRPMPPPLNSQNPLSVTKVFVDAP